MAKLASLREVLGKFVTGVTVVTIADVGPIGITANSFTSVSLDPPLILVCIHRSSRVHNLFTAEKPFAVNILGEHQRSTSEGFSASTNNRVDGVGVHCGSTGAPLLADALAYVECTLYQMIEAGDHTIVIGKVEAFDVRSIDTQPLVFYGSRYASLATTGVADYGLIESISVPESGRIPDEATGIATSAEYDNYFRLDRGATDLGSWTRTCLNVHQELLDDLHNTNLSAEDKNDLLRGLVGVQRTTLVNWLTSKDENRNPDQ